MRGSGIALVVSVLVAVYGALGVAHAIQHAMNVTWAVPRCRRPNPFHLRLRSLVLIAIGGLATIIATVLSGLASSATAFGADLDWLGAVLIVVAAIAVNAAVFVVGFWICVATDRSVRSLLPGALTAAVVWQVLQLGGAAYVGRVVTNTDATYGAFALVLGLIAWIFLASVAIVFSAEIDVVRYKRLYPRSLLTPFTDDVELTRRRPPHLHRDRHRPAIQGVRNGHRELRRRPQRRHGPPPTTRRRGSSNSLTGGVRVEPHRFSTLQRSSPRRTLTLDRRCGEPASTPRRMQVVGFCRAASPRTRCDSRTRLCRTGGYRGRWVSRRRRGRGTLRGP